MLATEVIKKVLLQMCHSLFTVTEIFYKISLVAKEREITYSGIKKRKYKTSGGPKTFSW